MTPRAGDGEGDTRCLDIDEEPISRPVERRTGPFVPALLTGEGHSALARVGTEPAFAYGPKVDEVRRERENLAIPRQPDEPLRADAVDTNG